MNLSCFCNTTYIIMACTSCSTSDGGAPKGCKNNGTCGTDSCNKLTVFDWLSNMSPSNGEAIFDCVEVRFKNGRKEFFRNSEKLTLSIGDIVATVASPGHDIGIVTLTGELVKIQMKKKGVNHESNEVPKIYRKASQKDIDIWSVARDREEPMKVRARELAIQHKLEMKISDIEFQGDGSKATFYYTANDRVDFRMLIKDFAKEFSTRVEMKQVGFRQEAARLGGVGSCGRELCCSTWLTDFRSVNTSAARYQQLSLNPQKLAGQCGKLKCCLNYELDTYMDALKDFPDYDTKLVTEKGDAVCQKQDIFKGLMWFAYTNNFANWHVLKIDQVKEIIAENKQKNKVSSLEDFAIEVTSEPEKDFNNAMGQESLTRFDQPKRKKKPNRKRKPNAENAVVAAAPSNKPQQGNNNNNNKQGGGNPNKSNKPHNKQNHSNKNKQNENKQNENKPAEPRKPIIITKNENKK
ncbi:Cell fate regulator YaaT, PSP1 superfamily (controls sporulation, competence, biofilm development) [Flavobacterium resistens]|uniref:Cell fate regulator YaaT, PSP1 superfamily (Controls sporulation, competence, biofilm development) n=2 Tax=Flavobacterium resistens TaxID=443612 RepID=A0A521E5X2_9FLAO|nr:Cell fate regulator YaaT, PSP1 superfamily (controls sporulation, competence, biofilm development) [Flavobacterium resistens]